MLAVEVAIGSDSTVESERGTSCFPNGLAIRDWEGSWVPHADFTYSRVRLLIPCIIIAAAEHLRLRIHLCVDFKADDDFEITHVSVVGNRR